MIYKLSKKQTITVNKKSRSYNASEGAFLTEKETADLFARNGKISGITVEVKL